MSQEVTAAIISASVAFIVALIGTIVTYISAKRDRRRKLYGEALKAALSWHELLYRVRRRAKGDEAALVSRFHESQETITNYLGWIGSESKSMERSYTHLVKTVKSKTEELINEAWNSPIRPAPGNALPEDEHPNVQGDAQEFLKDVRSHLSSNAFRRLAFWLRSRDY